MNRAPTDAPETVAYTTSGMLGGMIGPMVGGCCSYTAGEIVIKSIFIHSLDLNGSKAAGIGYCGTGHTSKDYAGKDVYMAKAARQPAYYFHTERKQFF